jgi:uncharacterized membrane protein (TIGR02234 family)
MTEQATQEPAAPRRSPAGAVLLCAAGGLLVLVSSGRIWAHATVHHDTGATSVSVTGHDVAASLAPIGIALLALSAAILAATGFMRRLVGLMIIVVAASAISAAFTARGNVSSALERHEAGVTGLAVHGTANGWWALAAIGGFLAVSAGILTVFRAGRWKGLGRKYDGPTAQAPVKDPAAVAWEALDRGEDPTA